MLEVDSNNGTRTVVVCAAILSVATIFASARFFCRVRMLDLLYADDWIIMLSLVSCPLTLTNECLQCEELLERLTLAYLGDWLDGIRHECLCCR